MAIDGNTIVPTMPVSPSGMGDFLGGGLGGGGGLLLLFFLLIIMGGGNGFGFGNGGNGYEWLNNSQNINDGFRDQALNANVGNIQSGVTSGFGDIQTALCGGFASVNASIANANTASMERSFAAQTAVAQDFNALQAQLAQCCCDNRMATVQTQNIVQAEGAATRLAIQNQTQQILDKLCQQEIDNLKAQNIALQNQLNMANLSASQTAQSQYIIDKLSA